MKLIVWLFFMFFVINAFSQTIDEKDVNNTIAGFFEGFHQRDSLIMKEAVSKDIILQTIGKNKEGKTTLETEDFNLFLKSIVSIPKDQKFEEKLLSFHIQIDGNMANVWAPYEFWLNGKFSHCGVDSFQLVKLNGYWKIVYLIDTRRKENCVQQE
ncbi:MAG: nuclear transport factor 2 family protein [Aquaticitalea sp.]